MHASPHGVVINRTAMVKNTEQNKKKTKEKIVKNQIEKKTNSERENNNTHVCINYYNYAYAHMYSCYYYYY